MVVYFFPLLLFCCWVQGYVVCYFSRKSSCLGCALVSPHLFVVVVIYNQVYYYLQECCVVYSQSKLYTLRCYLLFVLFYFILFYFLFYSIAALYILFYRVVWCLLEFAVLIFIHKVYTVYCHSYETSVVSSCITVYHHS